jgi:hypothetical protein
MGFPTQRVCTPRSAANPGFIVVGKKQSPPVAPGRGRSTLIIASEVARASELAAATSALRLRCQASRARVSAPITRPVAARVLGSAHEMADVTGNTTTPQTPEVREVQNAGVTVRLGEYKGGDIFSFEVKNLSAQPLLVDRDAIELITPGGTHLKRLPGGAVAAYTLQPASQQSVRVRFSAEELRQGDVVRFDFAKAVQAVGGATVAIPPLAVKYF